MIITDNEESHTQSGQNHFRLVRTKEGMSLRLLYPWLIGGEPIPQPEKPVEEVKVETPIKVFPWELYKEEGDKIEEEEPILFPWHYYEDPPWYLPLKGAKSLRPVPEAEKEPDYPWDYYKDDLEGLKETLFKVTFDPDRYSAVKIKFKPASDMKQVTVSIFSTGKIIVTGAQTLQEIAYAYNIINRHIISGAKKIKVSPTDTIETFNNFLGYSFDEMVEKLPRIGFRPWVINNSNYQINF